LDLNFHGVNNFCREFAVDGDAALEEFFSHRIAVVKDFTPATIALPALNRIDVMPK
jgi:hypothetical protein